jgi:hypothetical protein
MQNRYFDLTATKHFLAFAYFAKTAIYSTILAYLVNFPVYCCLYAGQASTTWIGPLVLIMPPVRTSA